MYNTVVEKSTKAISTHRGIAITPILWEKNKHTYFFFLFFNFFFFFSIFFPWLMHKKRKDKSVSHQAPTRSEESTRGNDTLSPQSVSSSSVLRPLRSLNARLVKSHRLRIPRKSAAYTTQPKTQQSVNLTWRSKESKNS